MKYIKQFENSKIKVGDLVMCINDEDRKYIKNGEIYTVTKIYYNIDTDKLYYNIDGDIRDYYAYRFRKLSDLEIKKLKYNL